MKADFSKAMEEVKAVFERNGYLMRKIEVSGYYCQETELLVSGFSGTLTIRVCPNLSEEEAIILEEKHGQDAARRRVFSLLV
jgi:hypothetical protein